MIIGICGFQSSGKDTIGDLLINEYGFCKLSFASILKDMISSMFGWSRDKLEGRTKEDREWREQIDPWWSKTLNITELSPRYMLQYFGTDLFRNHLHPDIWVKALEKQMIQLIETNKNIVITDCRFENEINLIIRYGGKIIHIYRNLPEWFENYKMGLDCEEIKSLHISEITWIRSYVDYEVENNGTIEELYRKIKYILFKTT